MIIREAKSTDVPEIVRVLKASLGEADLSLSEEIWNFKHVQNPFGKSIALVAVEQEKIIGVRAFMRWEWKKGETSFHTYRAVDTATHPDHRGKGIFKALTLRAVEVAKEIGGDFIFNTPNDQSRPGYLKMGWQISGKIKVGLKPSWYSFWKSWTGSQDYLISHKTSEKELKELCIGWNLELSSGLSLFTPKSPEYLTWRYEQNPLQNYEVFSQNGIYLAASVKKRRKIKELRIVECIFEDRKAHLKIRKVIRKWSSKFGVQVVSFSPTLHQEGGPAISGSFGPILTTRNLNLNISDKTEISNVENWSYSLGDLELF